MTRWRLAAGIGIAAAVVALAGACAPRLAAPPSLDVNQRRTRFERALALRERSGAGVEADVSVWVRWPSAGELPGTQARLLLGSPDRFRVRIESILGTAFDAAGHGDSLVAHVPPKRVGIELDARRDSLGVEDPGRLAFQVWSATWRPPGSAWSQSRWEDSLLVVSWPEAADTMRVAIGSHGLPVRVTRIDPRRGEVTARYPAWIWSDGVAWPGQIEFDEAKSGLEVRCRVNRVRFAGHAEEARLTLRLPNGTERLTRESLRRAIERIAQF